MSHRFISFLWFLCVVLGCASLSLPCVAQKAKASSQSDDEAALKKKAYGYFSKGELLFDAGDFIKAAEAFSLAYETLPHPATLLNVAICYEKADRPADAIEMYEKYLATSDPKDKEGRSGAEQRITALSKLAGQLDISCGMPSCEVKVDGKARGPAPVVIKVDPGTHTVEALSRGATVLSMEAVVRPGKATRVDLKALPGETSPQPGPLLPPVSAGETQERVVGNEPVEVPAADESEKTRDKRLRAPFWIASGATVVAGVVGIVFSARFRSDVDEFEKANGVDPEKADEWKTKGQTDMVAANVMWGITGAAAVTAAVLAIVDLTRKPTPAASASSARAESNLALWPGPGLGWNLAF